jgi:hypothetical protein
MKIVLFALLSVVLASCQGETDVIVGNRTSMEVEKVFNAGKVQKGELIRAEFIVKNTGEYPLIIADVSTSCSCTVSDYPKDPILPGETGKVIGNVDTERVSGARVDKAITILANTKPSKTELKIKGTIVNK